LRKGSGSRASGPHPAAAAPAVEGGRENGGSRRPTRRAATHVRREERQWPGDDARDPPGALLAAGGALNALQAMERNSIETVFPSDETAFRFRRLNGGCLNKRRMCGVGANLAAMPSARDRSSAREPKGELAATT